MCVSVCSKHMCKCRGSICGCVHVCACVEGGEGHRMKLYIMCMCTDLLTSDDVLDNTGNEWAH